MNLLNSRFGFQQLIAIFLTVIPCVPATPAIAGGGPENVLLVVNNDSDSSKLIANHYISLRDIPDRNVIYLSGIPFKESIPFEIFEGKILRPVLAAIEDRKLAGSIDYIVYSSDFPTTIQIPKIRAKFFAKAEEEGLKLSDADRKLRNGQASINSMTYLALFSIHAPFRVMDLNGNRYFRIPTSQILQIPFSGELQREFERSVSSFSLEPTHQLFEFAIESLLGMAKNNPGQAAVHYWLAKFYAKQGDETAATKWMTRAIAMGWSDRNGTQADPTFQEVSDPVFKGLVDRMSNDGKDENASRGFRQLYQWAPNGMLNKTAGQGERYFLSTVLAVTRNDGLTEAEAVRQLTRSVAADFTKPSGVFYFSSTKDVRSRTRKPKFRMAMETLQDLGYRAEIIESVLPKNKDDILGLTTGKANFDFSKSGSRIMPGAICENLTSFGGRLGIIGGQTKLSEFLRFGAAGSMGTVVEPYAVPVKFPSPMIHVHYARGCSLAESFYQSIHGPFQTLIVGDALCQPFATPPVVSVGGVEPMEKVSGTRQLTFDKSTSPVSVAGVELFVDGVMRKRDRLEPIDFNTKVLSDGYHEIRVVFIAANAIATTSRVVLPIVVDNSGHSSFLFADRKVCGFEDSISLSFASEGASAIQIRQHEKVLHRIEGDNGKFVVTAKELGRGPTTLRAIAIVDGKDVSSKPLEIKVNGPLSEERPTTSKRKPPARKPAKKSST